MKVNYRKEMERESIIMRVEDLKMGLIQFEQYLLLSNFYQTVPNKIFVFDLGAKLNSRIDSSKQ